MTLILSMHKNEAAWQPPKHAKLTVGPAPYTSPNEHQIVVKNHAVAINPFDWILQIAGNVAFPWIKYPFVLGTDVAGEVVEIGSSVTRFKVGDRVLGYAVGADKDANSSAEGAFQRYTILLERMASPLPADMPYENAAVLPLALSTAACGLFQKDQLALEYPTAKPKKTGKTLLIWGGSTSVGSNAIQLAVAAGYEVVTTASPKNFDYVKSLGASEVFDYKSPSVVADCISALNGKTIAGALAIGAKSSAPCVDIVAACEGVKFVSEASTPVSLENGMTPAIMFKMVSGIVALRAKCALKGVKTKIIYGSALKSTEVSAVIFKDFLPAALADGRYVAAPEPAVIGHGLDRIQDGFDAQRNGVSAKKIVVTL